MNAQALQDEWLRGPRRVIGAPDDPAVREAFVAYVARLRGEGGSVTGWFKADRWQRPVGLRLSRGRPPERATAELTLVMGVPRSSVWRPAHRPSAARADESLPAKSWNLEHSIATPDDIQDLYQELVEALNDASGSTVANPIRFEYEAIAGDPGYAQVGCLVTPLMAALPAIAGFVFLAVGGMSGERAAEIALGAAVAGAIAGFVPYNMLPRLASAWSRLREGETAGNIIQITFFAVPPVVTILALVLLNLATASM